MNINKLLICSLFVLAYSVSLYPQKGKMDDIRELLVVSGQFNKNSDIISNQISNMEDHYYGYIGDYFYTGFDFQMLTDTLLAIYDRSYTHEEIKELIRFYKTPAGQKLVNDGESLNNNIAYETVYYLKEIIDEFSDEFYARGERASEFVDSAEYFFEYLEPWNAIRAIDSAIMLNPFEMDFYYQSGLAHLWIKDFERAIQDLTILSGFEYYRDEIAPHQLLATAYYEQGRYKDFITSLFQIVTNEGIKYDADNLGDDDPENYVKSIEKKINRVIESDPDFGLAYFVRAAFKVIKHITEETYYTQDVVDFKSIKADLDKSISLEPELDEAYALRLQCHSHSGDWESLINDCNRLIEMKPYIADLYVYRARGRFFSGQYDKAIEDCINPLPDRDFDDVYYLDFDPTYPINSELDLIKGRSYLKTVNLEMAQEVWNDLDERDYYGDDYLLGHLPSLFGGDLARSSGSFDEAIELYYYGLLDQHIEGTLAPKMYEENFNKAFQYYNNISPYLGETFTEELLAMLNQEINNYPEPEKILFVRAHTNYYLNNLDKALDDLNQILIKNPEFKEAIYLRLWTRIKQEDYSGAIEDYSSLVDLGSGDVKTYYVSIAQIKEKMDDFQGMVEYLEKSIDGSSWVNNEETSLYIDALEKIGDLDRITEIYDEFNDFSSRIENKYRLGKIRLNAGDFGGALNVFTDIWGPELLILYGQSGISGSYVDYVHLDIRTELDQLIKSFPDSSEVYLVRGLLSICFNSLDEAMDDFNNMINRFPSSPEGYLGRAMVWSNLKKYNKALIDFDKALNIDPEYILAFYKRGETKSLMGDQAGACNDWQEFRLRYLNNSIWFPVPNYYCYPVTR